MVKIHVLVAFFLWKQNMFISPQLLHESGTHLKSHERESSLSCNEDEGGDAIKASCETTAIEKTSAYVSSRRSFRTDNSRIVRTSSHREAVR